MYESYQEHWNLKLWTAVILETGVFLNKTYFFSYKGTLI